MDLPDTGCNLCMPACREGFDRAVRCRIPGGVPSQFFTILYSY
jgi:hypothetical protein